MNTDQEIQGLIDIISNTLDAYSTVLFTAPGPDQPLAMTAFQSLSRNIDTEVKIGPGEGLIGWVMRNNQPVNIDQFESDTTRLMFYKADESIKSLMAVPLPSVHGVLSVDSKQRYIFTDKSHKILYQYSQALEMMLQRLKLNEQARLTAETLTFLSGLDRILGNRLDENEATTALLDLFCHYLGAESAFLAAIFPGDPKHYFVIGHNYPTTRPLDTRELLVGQGLAGWIMQKKKALFLDKIGTDPEKSFLFHPEEPVRKFQAFAGFPLYWGKRMLGALLFTGNAPFSPDAVRAQGLAIAAGRLASSLELELLFKRVAELGRLDSQVGLPNMTYFTSRLNRAIKLASVKGSGTVLLAVRLENLGQVAVESGQEAATEMLRNACRRLLASSDPEHELGLMSYGVIGVALTGGSQEMLTASAEELAGKLAGRPLETGLGHVRGAISVATAAFPPDGINAEELIQSALRRLKSTQPPAGDTQ